MEHYATNSVQFHLLLEHTLAEQVYRYAFDAWMADRLKDLLTVQTASGFKEDGRKNFLEHIEHSREAISELISPFAKERVSTKEVQQNDDRNRTLYLQLLSGGKPFHSVDALKNAIDVLNNKIQEANDDNPDAATA